jgi:hypothetical protein
VHNGGKRSALSAAPHFYYFFEQVHGFRQSLVAQPLPAAPPKLSHIASAYGAPFLLSMRFVPGFLDTTGGG